MSNPHAGGVYGSKKPLTIIFTGIDSAANYVHTDTLARRLDGLFDLPAKAIHATPIPKTRPKNALAQLYRDYAHYSEFTVHLEELRRKQPQHLVLDRGPEYSLVRNALITRLVGIRHRAAVSNYEALAYELVLPITIFLDVEPETAQRHMANHPITGPLPNYGHKYYGTVVSAYRKLAAEQPRWKTVDANTDNYVVVFDRIMSAVNQFINPSS